MHYFYKRLYFLNYVIIYEKAKDLSSEIIGEDDLDSILYIKGFCATRHLIPKCSSFLLHISNFYVTFCTY
jgi:hypothetical protein